LGDLGKLPNGSRLGEEEIVTPITIGEVLTSLCANHGITLRRDSTLILVNGVEANALEDLDTVVDAGDEVVLVPMFHGG